MRRGVRGGCGRRSATTRPSGWRYRPRRPWGPRRCSWTCPPGTLCSTAARTATRTTTPGPATTWGPCVLAWGSRAPTPSGTICSRGRTRPPRASVWPTTSPPCGGTSRPTRGTRSARTSWPASSPGPWPTRSAPGARSRWWSSAAGITRPRWSAFGRVFWPTSGPSRPACRPPKACGSVPIWCRTLSNAWTPSRVTPRACPRRPSTSVSGRPGPVEWATPRRRCSSMRCVACARRSSVCPWPMPSPRARWPMGWRPCAVGRRCDASTCWTVWPGRWSRTRWRSRCLGRGGARSRRGRSRCSWSWSRSSRGTPLGNWRPARRGRRWSMMQWPSC